jgi:YhgE/Pip-like protein
VSEAHPSTWLRRPITWLAVVVAGLLGSIMVFSYIGGFLNPMGNLSNAPIAFVDEDAGTNVAGQQVDAGQQIQQALTGNTGDGAIEWKVLSSQKEAESQIKDNEIWGAFVVPSTFSADLAAIGTSAATGQSAPQAKLEVLANEGSGLFQDSFFKELGVTAVAQASTEANKQISTLLNQAQVTIAPDAAVSLGDPVVADYQKIVELPDKGGRGLAPFYLAVMLGLTGFLAASIANITIDLERGAERLEVFGRELDFNVGDGSHWSLFVVKAICTALGAALGGVLAVATAVWILGMDVSSAPKAYAVGVLGAVTIGFLSLLFLLLFGLVGELIGVLFTTIFGVPSALGVYPSQAIPGFFSWISSWHPLRYMTDAMRSIAFFDGSGAGLGKAVNVLGLWLIVALVLCVAVAKLEDRRPQRATAARPVLQT